MNYQYHHTHPIQVRFNDIDMLGHTTNSVYMQYFDLGRLHYFIDVLNERMDWQGEGLILVSININYLAQTKLYNELEVRTKVTKLGNKSLVMHQQIYNKTTDEVAAEGKSTMVGYSISNEQSIPVPTRWRELFANYEKDIDL
jgi:acyl-CoA thioester hydrolase